MINTVLTLFTIMNLCRKVFTALRGKDLSAPQNKFQKTREGIAMFNTLIVEDNADFRQILLNLLHYQFPSMVLDEADSVEVALEKIKRRLPNLVFLDIRLPGENGLELTRKLKCSYPETIIVILTSYDLPEYREVASQYGANYFLSKGGTSTADEILKVVQAIVSNQGLS